MTKFRQPVLFLSHGGGPCFFMNGVNSPTFSQIDKNSKAAQFYKNLTSSGEVITNKPDAIVVISAHWEESVVTVSHQTSGTSLIYDYYGFPPETYAPHLTYPAPTDLNLANHINELLTQANIPNTKSNRGFDHGVFIPLKLAIPDASIPIVQVSIQSDLDPEYHIQLGEALSSLRDENILIIGSGSTTHNLREIMSATQENSHKYPWSQRFTDYLYKTLEISSNNIEQINQSRQSLSHIYDTVPDLPKVHPRTEHLVPLHVAFGAAYGTYLTEDKAWLGQCEPSEGGEGEKEVVKGGANKMFGRRIFELMVNGVFAIDSYVFE